MDDLAGVVFPPKQELLLAPGWMNAAGMLGFTPAGQYWQSEPPIAFVTYPVSEFRRQPANNRALIRYPGGFLLHTGLPNPGFKTVLRQHARRWARSNLPVWVHILAEDALSVRRMISRLETCEGVAAVELSLPDGASQEQKLAILQAAGGELPVVLNVPLNQAQEAWVHCSVEMGVQHLTIGAPRGRLADQKGSPVEGRLYAAGLFPLALQTLAYWHGRVAKVLLGCGVFNHRDYQTALSAGAAAVQFDVVLWRGGI